MSAASRFDVDGIRRRFPSIEQAGSFIFFDNAAGAQVPGAVIDAVTSHLLERNVQRGGPYQRSRDVDATIARARGAVAAFVNAPRPEDIAFGLNATSFMRALSLAIGQDLSARPEVIVTEADHEANVACWLALERFGGRIVWWRVRDDGRLHTADLEPLLGERTRIVACTMATNATGIIVDVATVARVAHRHGAEVFVDAVHYAPHGPIDVQQIGCDYLVCSGYKIFAPHMGFAYCRREAIERLATYREHFIPDLMPDKLEAGTYGYESVAGMEAAVAYLESLADAGSSRRERIHLAMTGIAAYERGLSAAMLDAIESIPGTRVYGVTDRAGLGERVPTFAFTVTGVAASAIAEGLAAKDVGLRSGHMYSPRLVARLGCRHDGVVRASLVHYNTVAEIARFRSALEAVIDAAARKG